jgi:DNA-binding CsgD family transcriptional regulator
MSRGWMVNQWRSSNNEVTRAGLNFADASAVKMNARQVRLRGNLPWRGADDARQDLHLALCEAYGPGYLEILGRLVLGPRESREDLRRVMTRAVERPHWRESKRCQREQPTVGPLVSDVADPRPDEADTLDRALDIEFAIAGLDPQSRAVWPLLRQGLTTREIGAQVGVSHQTVASIRNELIRQLARRLGD